MAALALALESLAVEPDGKKQDIKDVVWERIEAVAGAMRQTPQKLTRLDFDTSMKEVAPEIISAAGIQFEEAWQEYQRARSLHKMGSWGGEKSPSAKSFEEWVDGWAEYDKALEPLLHGNECPAPESFVHFNLGAWGWCGTDEVGFRTLNEEAILLACLRRGRYGDALELLRQFPKGDNVRNDILSGIGILPQQVLAGGWLAGRAEDLVKLCKEGDDHAAQLTVRWAALHWGDPKIPAVVRSRHLKDDETVAPEVPTWEMVYLLQDGNKVSDQEKRRVAEFLRRRGFRLRDYHEAIETPPPGAERWLSDSAGDR